MFHPVGSQPPSVYWRRRLFLLGSLVLLIVLVVLTINAIGSGGGGQADANSPAGTSGSTRPRTSSAAPRTTTSAARPSSSSTARPATKTTSAPRSASSTPVPDCAASNLQLRAVTGKTSYRVGDSPVLQLQVTNAGAAPCVQDLADKQVELRVYNGESRIWGSHDCNIAPGTIDRTLTPGQAVLVTITWTGATSKPSGCAHRQQVGAGTYTLYASLDGHQARATQFTIS